MHRYLLGMRNAALTLIVTSRKRDEVAWYKARVTAGINVEDIVRRENEHGFLVRARTGRHEATALHRVNRRLVVSERGTTSFCAR